MSRNVNLRLLFTRNRMKLMARKVLSEGSEMSGDASVI